jgi:hypothetical protein
MWWTSGREDFGVNRCLFLLMVVWLWGSLSSAGFSQVSEDYVDAINRAIFMAEDGDLDGGYDAAVALLDIADTDEERLRSRDLAMNIAMAAERWLDAENQAYAGAQLVRENYNGQPDLLRPFLERQAEAARQQGAMDRYQRLTAEWRSASLGLLALNWNSERNGERHRLTGFLCPLSLNGWPISQWHANELDGPQAECMYRNPAAPDSGLGLAIYQPAIRDLLAEMADEFLGINAERSAFSAGTPFTHENHELSYHAAYVDARAVQAWQAMSGEWAVLLTSYSDTAIPEPARAALVSEAFASLDRMNDHLSRCELSRGRTEFGREERIVGMSMTMMMAAMLPHPVGQFQPDEDTLDCLIGRLGSGALDIAYAEVDRRGRPQRFVARPANGEVPYITAARSRELRNVERNLSGRTRGGMPFVMSQHLDRRVDTYGVFDGPPSAAGFLEQVERIMDGRSEASAGVYIDEEGDTVIDISNMSDD